MQNETIAVATRFVDIALKNPDMDSLTTLPNHQIQILFDIVSEAGFKPKKIALGFLFWHYFNKNGILTEEIYQLNTLCPFKVVNQNNENNLIATYWLDCVSQCVLNGFQLHNKNRYQLIKLVLKKILCAIHLNQLDVHTKE